MISTEILRCHPRRPGLLNAGARQAIGANEGVIDVESAVATFQKAMDSCMKVEKEFLESGWGQVRTTDTLHSITYVPEHALLFSPDISSCANRNMLCACPCANAKGYFVSRRMAFHKTSDGRP